MTGYFHAELSALDQYVTSLQDGQQQLEELSRLMSGSRVQLGNEKLDHAASDFQKSWEYGAKRLSEAVTVTAEAVRQAARAFATADQDVADAIYALSRPPGTNGGTG